MIAALCVKITIAKANSKIANKRNKFEEHGSNTEYFGLKVPNQLNATVMSKNEPRRHIGTRKIDDINRVHVILKKKTILLP